jgi:5-formyltetrahydrofolate cyclo-ligase
MTLTAVDRPRQPAERPDPTTKAAVRELVWRMMEARGVARFPGARGRIPNFAGAERAALALQGLPAWQQARVVKINPDAPQLPVRRMALREGKVVYMPVPRLGELACFIELDPACLGRQALQAASIKGAARLGRPVMLEDVPTVDLIVCGSVAVNAQGARVGKGGGFSDLEYGLLAEAGRVTESTPIVTTVHPVQIVPYPIEMRQHDIPVTTVAAPDGLIPLAPTFPRPRGIYPGALTPEKIREVPVLGRLLGRD